MNLLSILGWLFGAVAIVFAALLGRKEKKIGKLESENRKVQAELRQTAEEKRAVEKETEVSNSSVGLVKEIAKAVESVSKESSKVEESYKEEVRDIQSKKPIEESKFEEPPHPTDDKRELTEYEKAYLRILSIDPTR